MRGESGRAQHQPIHDGLPGSGVKQHLKNPTRGRPAAACPPSTLGRGGKPSSRGHARESPDGSGPLWANQAQSCKTVAKGEQTLSVRPCGGLERLTRTGTCATRRHHRPAVPERFSHGEAMVAARTARPQSGIRDQVGPPHPGWSRSGGACHRSIQITRCTTRSRGPPRHEASSREPRGKVIRDHEDVGPCDVTIQMSDALE